MKSQRIKHRFFILLLSLLLLWAFIAIGFFIHTLTQIERTSTEKTLSEIARSNAAQVKQVFAAYTSTLQTMAIALEAYDDFSSSNALAYLNQAAEIQGFNYITIDYLDGKILSSHGETFYHGSSRWADRIKRGESFVLDVTNPYSTGVPEVSVLVPLHDKTGASVAALRCDFSLDALSKLFDATFSNAGGYYRLLDSNGRHVSVSNSPNLLLANRTFFDALDALNYEDGFSAEQIKHSFFNHQEGFTKYSYEGKHRYAYYLPVGINGWLLFMVIPKEIMEVHSIQHKENSLILCSQIVIIFSILLFFLYFTQRKEKNAAILHDRYLKVLEEQTGKVIFEWDFASGIIVCLSDFKAIYGREPLIHGSIEDTLSQKVIHEDDHELCRTLYASILQGNPLSDARFRILHADGTYLWSSLSAIVVMDNKNHPFKAIATLENIDRQVREENDLRNKAELDGLTSLYNKSTTEYLVTRALEQWRPGDCMCVLMIDVDNFKEVNDTLGHLYGDIVLSSLAKHLKHSFSPGDIIGRIGGDEFFVFMQNYSSIPRLASKVTKIENCFRNTYQENGQSVHISASIGIAIFPEHGNDFDTLYQHADMALYTAKASGKDTFRIFDGTNCADYCSSRTTVDSASLLHSSLDASRLQELISLLYHADDTNTAIQASLRLLAQEYHVSQAFVFEFDPSRQFVSCTFSDTCDTNAPPSSTLQNIPLASCDLYFHSLHKNDFFILSERSKLLPNNDQDPFSLRHTQMMLHFAIKEQGHLVGSIRFDFHEENRTFTDAELQVLSSKCHVLSAFLLKQRSQERVEFPEMAFSLV